MAEQIPLAVAKSLFNTLASPAFKEIASIYGVNKDIDWLESTVGDIKAVLADADKKQHTEERIQNWIRRLKQVLYEADDLLDEVHTQYLLRNRDAEDNKGMGKVLEFFSPSNPILFRHKIAHDIENIREKFNAVTENMSKLNLDRTVVVEMNLSNGRETSSKPEENIIGRVESEKEVIHLLLNTNDNENVSLVAIVGIGGLGKTVLAQLVYHNAQVNNFFDEKIWVCVSDKFDVTLLVKKILELLTGVKEPDNQQLEMLQKNLEKNLKGKKYLLVLDDVWNEDKKKWLHLKKYLMCGAQGSKILLTTRDETVTNKMEVKTLHSLKPLTNDQSWTLLRSLAFDKDEIINKKLESIGQEIAKKCAGVPLAIKVMGGLLRDSRVMGGLLRESDWEAILEGDFWKSCKDSNSIMPILKLSYDHLASELKQCFVYCSLYPKDWVYRKDELIDLWMAQGFLEYDEGEKYVRILLMKSFLQDDQRDELGEIECFKMHDLMHDLCESIASSDDCLYVEGRKNVVRCPIHASFEEYNSNSLRHISNPCRLRTFLEIKEKSERNLVDLFVFERLRSLDLSGYDMRDLPESIGKMRHLRYLNLSGCELTCLPKSISDLVNLQTLRLQWCDSLEFSIDIITKLINLRRLDIKSCKAFEDGMPIGLGRMTTLQRLSHFIVGNDDKETPLQCLSGFIVCNDDKEKAKLNELKDLNLRGGLSIQKLGLVRDVEEESKDVNLRTKKNLISLSLDWGRDLEIKNSDCLQLLENLCPHENLKALEIKEYPGVCLPDWLLSCTNLVELKFWDCKNCQYLTAMEGLVSLKTLYIINMDELEYIYYKECSSSANFFPSLQELLIVRCGRLRGWVSEENVQNTRVNFLPPFSRLLFLRIYGCPELSCMPTFPNLVRGLELTNSSTKPLQDTLSDDKATSLSMLKSLHIGGIDLAALREDWMKNLSSLDELHITHFSSPEEPFRHMRNLSAKLEEFQIWYIDSWRGDENYNIQCQNLCCLHSLKRIYFYDCVDLMALPEWICDLHSLRLIDMRGCENVGEKQERTGPKLLTSQRYGSRWIESNFSLHTSKENPFFLRVEGLTEHALLTRLLKQGIQFGMKLILRIMVTALQICG
ncbi:hypothetical protein K1719_039110 [Acacia pycnantha]|nr:hypothetical protein K1719_039110 [Acacia pycnantha]